MDQSESPFTSSIFETCNTQTIRQVYRTRIINIYHSQFPILKTKIEEKENKESIEDIAQQKLNKALELLDIEYFGREQEFYELIFDKYQKKCKMEMSKEKEFMPSHYFSPLISEILQQNKLIECSECLQKFESTEFADDEWSNGPYLACKRCAPDRNNVIAMKWHKTYKSDTVILENNDSIAKVTLSNHRYALIDMIPVTKGIHCWRWKTRLYQTWFLWGISHSKKYSDNSYGSQNVFGIAGSNQSYKNGACQYSIQTGIFFGGKTEVLIDMLLDLTKGVLSFKIPGHDTEAKMDGIPKDSQEGFVPHVNLHYAAANVQIKKIPHSWYGQNPKRVKFV